MTMTNAEYLIEQIRNRFVEVPELTVTELQAYLNGYAQCQKDIINLIRSMSERN